MKQKQPKKKQNKKPKGFKPGSKKGRWTQYLSDSVKKMKEDGFIWITRSVQGKRCRTKLVIPDMSASWSGREGLLKGKGGFRFVHLVEKDGLKAETGNGPMFHIQPENIVALVEPAE